MRSSRPRIPLRLSLALVALHILLAAPCQPADVTDVPSPERRVAERAANDGRFKGAGPLGILSSPSARPADREPRHRTSAKLSELAFAPARRLAFRGILTDGIGKLMRGQDQSRALQYNRISK